MLTECHDAKEDLSQLSLGIILALSLFNKSTQSAKARCVLCRVPEQPLLRSFQQDLMSKSIATFAYGIARRLRHAVVAAFCLLALLCSAGRHGSCSSTAI